MYTGFIPSPVYEKKLLPKKYKQRGGHYHQIVTPLGHRNRLEKIDL